MANQEEITQYNILQSIENGEQMSQRQLSSQLGINVASINFALKKLTKRGFVKMLSVNPRRMQYILTPKGNCRKKHRLPINSLTGIFISIRPLEKMLKIKSIAFHLMMGIVLLSMELPTSWSWPILLSRIRMS